MRIGSGEGDVRAGEEAERMAKGVAEARVRGDRMKGEPGWVRKGWETDTWKSKQ